MSSSPPSTPPAAITGHGMATGDGLIGRTQFRPGGRLVLCDAVVDHQQLPAELRGPLATVACVGEALPEPGYRLLLDEADFEVSAAESRGEDAAALADRRVLDRLRGARVLGLDRIEGSPLDLNEAIAMARLARKAIDDGVLGYTIFAAVR